MEGNETMYRIVHRHFRQRLHHFDRHEHGPRDPRSFSPDEAPDERPPHVMGMRFGGPEGFGRHRHFGGRGGPRVGRGDVRAATLLLLADRPMHGYQVIQEIAANSGGVWRPSAGSVYPALQLLEDEGLVRAEQTDGRRVFYLTDAGRTYVEERRAELIAARDAVTDNVDGGVVALHDLFMQVGVAIKQVAHAGTPAQIATAQDLLKTTRRQLYRILAGDDSTSES